MAAQRQYEAPASTKDFVMTKHKYDGVILDAIKALEGSIKIISREVMGNVMPNEQTANYNTLTRLQALVDDMTHSLDECLKGDDALHHCPSKTQMCAAILLNAATTKEDQQNDQ